MPQPIEEAYSVVECHRLLRHELECARKAVALLGDRGHVAMRAIEAAIQYDIKARTFSLNSVVSGTI